MKKYSCKSFLIFAIVLISQTAATGQDKTLQRIRQDFDQSDMHTLFEKIFVHTDKTVYVAGEIIWFKVYQTDGFLNQPIEVSKITYVEILTSDKKPILQAKIGMNSGTGNGSFLIPTSLQSGNFIFRAYTNWMKNFSANQYFEKQITIVNPLKRPDWQPPDTSRYNIQFFPEGGNLVRGIKSKIGFRVTDPSGRGVNCSGVLINQNNDTVGYFKTARFGIGHFNFSPQPGNLYKATIAVNDTLITGYLPSAYDKGYVMTVLPVENDQLQVQVNANTGSSNPTIYLLTHQRQIVTLALKQSMQNGVGIFTIDKKDLRDGISYLTLFDGNGEPLCERLYFKRPGKKLRIKIEADQELYQTKKPVRIELSASTETLKASNADLSISVFLVDTLQPLEQNEIFSYLWLDSDFNGHIESPGYYCSTSGIEADEAVDDLMLTHGWRKFNWEDKDSISRATLQFIPEYEGHIVEGTVSSRKTGIPKSGATAYLSIPGERFQFSNSISDEKGHISFIAKDFYGAEEIILQTDHKEDSGLRVDISSPFSKTFSDLTLPSFHLSSHLKNPLVARSIGAQSQNLFLTDSIRRFFLPLLQDTSVFYGNPDKQYLLDDYTRFITMEEVMREFVTEVQVRKRNDLFHFQVYNDPFKKFFDEPPLVLLDGVPVFDIGKMVSFDPLKIKKIEIVTQRYYYGTMVYHGILSYQTYDGDLAGFELDPSSVVVEYEGLQLKREFYSPTHEAVSTYNSRLPDFRNVLYWSPDIRCEENRTTELKFYTSEIPGTYAIVVQGITPDGYAGSNISTFSVAAPPKQE